MIKKLQIRDDVAIDIHRHEARKLQKARIDIPSTSRVTKGHDADAILRKPCTATLLHQKIDQAGTCGLSCASIRAMAAISGTAGWQTPIVCTIAPSCSLLKVSHIAMT